MGDLWRDFQHALRLFRQSPGFALAAISALALCIGANTAIFTVVNAVLLRPLSYPDADRLVLFMLRSPDGDYAYASIPNFELDHRQTSVFEGVAGFDGGGPGFNITEGRPEQVHGMHVTEGYFRVFGAPVELGRTFTAEEDAPNGGHVVVISHGLWQRRYGGDEGVTGRTISLGNEPYTIIGVLSRRFQPEEPSDLWLPFQFDPNSQNLSLIHI